MRVDVPGLEQRVKASRPLLCLFKFLPTATEIASCRTFLYFIVAIAFSANSAIKKPLFI